ncbi:hypothetical protein C3A78_14225 [Salmonella enterica subsp. enterica serovar Poona]|nr:hypothetical protein [Salmonella enterica subsp. enterica serovar Typhimurium]EBZ8544894.1 hypothetical protein [Salmonella enterica subsp. enterica serovar Muenchen]EEE3543002.1 hypothetical protein [Salmonella enterica subsp. enterica serovar Poona]EBW9713525.1 hypothetical protein [Salmonella enterica subsp. enterica serovar Typhimurium]EIT7107764.1 hypothetical protein [Salmonella enterica subsp. enterica serovar Typhimurium]
MSDEENKIVQLVHPDADEKQLLNVQIENEKTYRQKTCPHYRVRISEVERSFYCSVCNTELDPFEYLLQCARDARHVVTEIETLRQRAGELRTSVANLEREEKNAKARLRSARTAILYAENDLKNVEQGVKK